MKESIERARESLPFLSSSAAKENVKAVAAMSSRMAYIFMFIERITLF